MIFLPIFFLIICDLWRISVKFSLLSAAPVLANWLLYDPLCGHNRGSDGGFGLATTTTTTKTTVGQREGMGWFSLAIVAGIWKFSDISIFVQSKLYRWRKLKRWQFIFCLTSSFQILDCFRAVYWIFWQAGSCGRDFYNLDAVVAFLHEAGEGIGPITEPNTSQVWDLTRCRTLYHFHFSLFR